MAAERLGGDLQPFDGDRGRHEMLAAHAGQRAAGVRAARLQVAQQVEHARIVEVHADQHQVEALAREFALRLTERAHERQVVA